MGLFQQATQHIWQSPDCGGEASYSKGGTRPIWVFRNGHPVGPQGRHRCRVGNFPEARPAFGEVPETLWPTGVWTLGLTEVRGMRVVSPGESTLCAEDGYSPDEHLLLYIEL